MRDTCKSRWLALMMSLALLTQLGIPALAAEAAPDGSAAVEITDFAVLDTATAYQTVEAGTELDALDLPGTLTVTIDVDDAATVEHVTWESDPAYDPAAEHVYTFTPILPEGYSAASTASPPKIRVTLGGGAEADGAAERDLLAADPETLSLADQLRQQALLSRQRYASPMRGTAENPYLIATADQLAELATLVNAGNASFKDKYYKQTRDIDLGDISTWTPIGWFNAESDAGRFVGTYDGQGYAISNLTVSDEQSAGLFGYAENSTIKNVIMVDPDVRGTSAGAVVSGGGTVTGCAMVGGTVVNTSENYSAGGVVGVAYGNVTNCYATGVVSSAVFTSSGGVVGSAKGSVTNCYATGAVSCSSSSNFTGGVVGYVDGGGSVSNCVALNASVSGDSNTHRVAGKFLNSGEASDSYAWYDMKVNGNTVTAIGDNEGDPLTCENKALSKPFNEMFDMVVDTTVWKTLDTTGLPILNGSEKANAAQSTALPVHLTDAAPADVYIHSLADLEDFRDHVNGEGAYAGKASDFSGKTVKLTADLDLGGVENWMPIGKASEHPVPDCPFAGTFDGQGYAISNLTSSGHDDCGLFGLAENSTIQNVIMVAPNVAGTRNAGAVVGHSGTVTGCAMVGGAVVNTGSNSNAGGVVGTAKNISNCYATGTVNGSGYTGGVVGLVVQNDSMSNCYATGAVSDGGARDASSTGGVVGYMIGGSVSNCVALNASVVNTGGSRIYRVAGYLNGGGAATDSYAWSGMRVNAGPVTGDAGNQGTDLSGAGGTLTTSFKTIFENDVAWTYTDNGLPILNGSEKAVAAQSTALPAYVTETDPNVSYINSLLELEDFRDHVNGVGAYAGKASDFSDKTVKLTANLDLKDEANWAPIGTWASADDNKPFSGTFDGQGYAISNLKIDRSDAENQGLFGYAGTGTIQNVILVNPDVTGEKRVGAVVGSGGIVTGCAMVGGTVSGSGNIGGVAGEVVRRANNCYATGTVSGTGINTGGVVGCSTNGNISNCYATGAVSGTGNVGGVVGNVSAVSDAEASNCAALNASVTGDRETRRVVGLGKQATASYAWSGMRVNNNTVTGDAGDTGNQGRDLTGTGGTLSTSFADIFTGDKAVWKTLDATGLPILKGPAEALQSTALPEYVTTAADDDLAIDSLADLKNFRTAVNSGTTYRGKTVTLNVDLDLKDEANWEPIGVWNLVPANNHPFEGTFEGNGHNIKNLTIDGILLEYQGLFGYAEGGTIQNLILVNPHITGGNYTGAVVGFGGTVTGCAMVGGTVSSGWGLGGIGGVAGVAGNITNCYATGAVSGSYDVGGVSGGAYGNVTNCYATGAVSGIDDNVGGVVGRVDGNNNDIKVTNCVALNPSVTGVDKVHRVVGKLQEGATTGGNFAWDGTTIVDTAFADDETPFFLANGAAILTSGESVWPSFRPEYWTIPEEMDALPYLTKNDQRPTLSLAQRAARPAPTITVNPVSATYAVGDAATPLTVDATSPDGNPLTYQWYISDEDVEMSGTRVRGERNASYTPPTDTAGTFYYYAAVVDAKTGLAGFATSELARVTVAVPVTGVTLNKVELTLRTGANETLTATVAPVDATDRAVTWASGDAAVATVVDGKVTALKAGTTAITATAGGKTATCQLTVNSPSSDDDDDHDREPSRPGATVTVDKPTGTPGDPNPPTEGTIQPPATVDKDGKVDVNIPDTTIQDAIDKAVAQAKKDGTTENGISISIDLSGLKTQFNTLPLTLSKNAYQKLVSAGVRSLDIRTPQISLSLDLETLKTISDTADGDVTIDAAKADRSALTGAAQAALGDRPLYEITIVTGGKKITKFGGKITITLPYAPATGETSDGLWMAWVNADGGLTYITDSVYQNGSMTAQTDHLTVFGVAEKPGFTDVPADAWYAQAVQTVVGQGLFSGTSATTFDPEGTMTRGMVVTVLHRMAGEPVADAGVSFPDVAPDSYCAAAVAWASGSGLVEGYGDGTFGPDDAVTREQLAAILYRYAGSPAVPNLLLTFTDAGEIGDWASDAVRWVVDRKLLQGSGNLLMPQGIATRAQVAAILARFLESDR